jgi:predicted ATP-grasp superfamily ATP-dependent carboligase
MLSLVTIPNQNKKKKRDQQALYNKVLIVDYAEYDSIGEMPYLFHTAGCEVSVFCSRNSWLLKNSYWDTWVQTGSSDISVYMQDLIQHVQTTSYDWIILGDDALLRALNDSSINETLFRKLVPVSKIENRIMVGSKAGLSSLCTKYDIVTPAYALYSDRDSVRAYGQAVGFPLLIKLDRSEGGCGVFLCEDEQALTQQLSLLSESEKSNCVLQKYVDGDIIAIEALYKEGKLLSYVYSKVTKVVFRQFGISSERIYSLCPKLESELGSIGEKLGFNGFVTMTMMYEEKTHTHYLVEADLRPQVWFRFAVFAGVDFSKSIRNFLDSRYEIHRPVFPLGIQHVTMWNFSREIIRYGLDRNVFGLFAWTVNWHGRWRFIPWYDSVLLRAVVSGIMQSYGRGISKAVLHPFKKQLSEIHR